MVLKRHFPDVIIDREIVEVRSCHSIAKKVVLFSEGHQEELVKGAGGDTFRVTLALVWGCELSSENRFSPMTDAVVAETMFILPPPPPIGLAF